MKNANEATDKIRKILATAASTDAAGEADTAKRLAEALAMKHGIDLDDVQAALERPAAVITHKVLGTWSKVPPEAVHAATLCKAFFDVRAFFQEGWDGSKVIAVGTESQLTVAGYVFEFVVAEMRRRWNTGRGRCKKRVAFMRGIFQRLYLDLKENQWQPPAGHSDSAVELHWPTLQDDYIRQHFGALQTVERKQEKRISAAMQRGFKAGAGIRINPAVRGETVLQLEDGRA